MWTRDVGVAGSNPALVTIKTPLVGKATGSHLIKSTSLGRTQTPASGFCYARNRVRDAVYDIGSRRVRHLVSRCGLIATGLVKVAYK